MIYGTLVGIALFVVIVILCWMLSTKLERDKQRKKREEQVRNFKVGPIEYLFTDVMEAYGPCI